MIIASVNGPAGFGYATFGQSSFVQGKDFNCNSSICYGIGTTNHELLKQLQQAINSFAPLAGFTPITVDGFIGAGSVNAGAQAARVIRGQALSGSAIITQLANGMTKEQIATNAPGLLAALQAANSTASDQGAPVQVLAPAATAPEAPAAAPTPAPSESAVTKAVDFVKSFFQPSASPTPGGFGPASTTPGAATAPGATPAAAATSAKVPTWVWILAGVVGVGVIGGIGYAIFHTPAEAPAPVAAKAPAPAAAKAVGRRTRHRRRRATR
jgi:hypothetical protein